MSRSLERLKYESSRIGMKISVQYYQCLWHITLQVSAIRYSTPVLKYTYIVSDKSQYPNLQYMQGVFPRQRTIVRFMS